MVGESLLQAMTPASRKALGGERYLLSKLPFRVGRRERLPSPKGLALVGLPSGKDAINDFLILESGDRRFISREHFLIDRRLDEGFYLVDRGSTLGTLVEGRLIGGDKRGGEVRLGDGAIIIPGGQDSPYIFRFKIK